MKFFRKDLLFCEIVAGEITNVVLSMYEEPKLVFYCFTDNQQMYSIKLGPDFLC